VLTVNAGSGSLKLRLPDEDITMWARERRAGGHRPTLSRAPHDFSDSRAVLRVVVQEVENGAIGVHARDRCLSVPEVAKAHRGRDPLEN